MSTADQTLAFFGNQADRVQGRFGSKSALRGGKAVPTFDIATAGWSKSSRRAARGARRAARDAWIALDADFMETLIQWGRAHVPAVVEAFEEEFLPMAQHAFDQWPVASGTSKDGLVVTVTRPDASTLKFSFVSVAPYTFFIKYAQNRRERVGEFRERIVGSLRMLGGLDMRSSEIHAALSTGNVESPRVTQVAQWFQVEPWEVVSAWGAWLRAERGEGQREVYELPGGGDAAGKAAWQVQAKSQLRPVTLRMSERIQAALDRAVKAAA